jgi:demethylmenaquinone methyltransferase/2-methoxy-6-polyprenyl-1,4-benzoquinol methylase
MMGSTQAPVKPWQTVGEERSTYARRLFGDIAGVYDLQNSLMTLGGHHRWRRRAVKLLDLKPGECSLDLCCGTGDFAVALAHAGSASITAIDFSEPMLVRAKSKTAKYGVGIALADALHLPLADSSMDAITVGWGIRNLGDIRAGFAEMFRVLRPGGRFVVLDMAKPTGPFAGIATWSFKHLTPLIGALVGQREAYRYLPNSVDNFPSREELKRTAEDVGFSNVDIHNLTPWGICVIHRGVK